MVENLPREHKTHSTGTTIILFYSYKKLSKATFVFCNHLFFIMKKSPIKQKNACYLKN